jgi:uncharacterized protein
MSQPGSLPTIAVHGTAERSVAPDSYVVLARVSVEAAQTGAASTALAQRFGALEAAVAELAHLRLDVERSGVSMYEDPKPFGDHGPVWHGSRALTLTGHDTSQVGELAGALGRVPNVAIEGPLWQIERDHPVHAEIQAEAVHAAQQRAERYAVALGGVLGRLVELSDTGMGGFEPMRVASSLAMDSGGMPGLETLDFTPQPVEVSASVNGRWYLTLAE